jgi:hypothetical protein
LGNIIGKAKAQDQGQSAGASPVLTGGPADTIPPPTGGPVLTGAGSTNSEAADPLDYTSRYNTRLSARDETRFQDWMKTQSERTGHNVGDDLYDYDLRGWWKEHQDADLTAGVHLNDKYKKPNHPTFSTESQYHGRDGNAGGRWEKQGDNSWRFTAGRTNVRMRTPRRMRAYFDRVEPGNELVIPDEVMTDTAGAP